MRFLQELENIFLKISSCIDLSLIQERRRAAGLNLPCDL
jgi:hypothetical protein